MWSPFFYWARRQSVETAAPKRASPRLTSIGSQALSALQLGNPCELADTHSRERYTAWLGRGIEYHKACDKIENMKILGLKQARLQRGWTQQTSSRRLGVSQSYLSMLEAGDRPLTQRLAKKMMDAYKLPPTVLPPVLESPASPRRAAEKLAEELAVLGYPGFAYWRSRAHRRNPYEVVLAALAQPNLEARLVEALPWLLVRYADSDTRWLEEHAKLQDLQNRLGFVATMARYAAEKNPGRRHEAQVLAQLEERLHRSRLAREDTLCQQSMTQAEERWLRHNRSPEARKWNLLTHWTPEHFRYTQDA